MEGVEIAVTQNNQIHPIIIDCSNEREIFLKYEFQLKKKKRKKCSMISFL